MNGGCGACGAGPRRTARGALAGTLATRGLYELAQRSPASARWLRPNYRDRAVSLAGGPAFALGALGSIAASRDGDRRLRVAALVAGGAAAIAGALDDVRGSGRRRGLRGHLGALRQGEITTGAAKVAVIGSAGLVAGWLVTEGSLVRRAAAGAVVAGSANLVNLVDLRPGRAVKVALLAAGPLALAGGSQADIAAIAGGAASAMLPADLGERAMLGDTGANCLGALLGVALVARASTRRLLAGLAVCAGLTIASERVSFSRVIDATPVLRWFDRLGRLDVSADA